MYRIIINVVPLFYVCMCAIVTVSPSLSRVSEKTKGTHLNCRHTVHVVFHCCFILLQTPSPQMVPRLQMVPHSRIVPHLPMMSRLQVVPSLQAVPSLPQVPLPRWALLPNVSLSHCNVLYFVHVSLILVAKPSKSRSLNRRGL